MKIYPDVKRLALMYAPILAISGGMWYNKCAFNNCLSDSYCTTVCFADCRML